MPGQRFPHIWGYWVGFLLVLAGIIVAVIGAVNGVTGFADDVNDLRRVLGGTNEIEASLESGEEIVVYDEADFGAGPFEVTVIRVSDGAEVSTSEITDGATYEVDGREGRARVGFRVPSSDIYRVEVDTSVGQIARFAVGADVGNDRANTVVAGLAWGGFLALAGFVVIVVTMVLHARWKVRSAIPGQIDKARRVLEGTAREAVDAPARAVSAGHEQVTSWTRENVEKAKQHLPSSAGDSEVSGLAGTIQSKGSEWIDAANQVLTGSQTQSTEGVTTADLPNDLLDRVGASLDRIEARVAAGDSLRAIARDERALVEETVREVAAQTAETQEQVGDRFAATEQALRERAATEVGGAQADLVELGTIAFDDALAQVTDAGDELTLGLATTAGAAAAAGAAVVQDRADKVLEPPPPPPPPAPRDEEREYASGAAGGRQASDTGTGQDENLASGAGQDGEMSSARDLFGDPSGDEPEADEMSSAKALFGDPDTGEPAVEEMSSAKALFDEPALDDELADEPLFEGSLSDVLEAEEQRFQERLVEHAEAAGATETGVAEVSPDQAKPAADSAEEAWPTASSHILAPPPQAVTAFASKPPMGDRSEVGEAERAAQFVALAPPPSDTEPRLPSSSSVSNRRRAVSELIDDSNDVRTPSDPGSSGSADDTGHVHPQDELPEPVAPDAFTLAPPPDYDNLVHS
ncbi:MAG: hypothetical protein ACR2PK_05365 [Acidimicrobiales bacterium]